MSNILLVGAGQLGSRYLQGLAEIEGPTTICVVDPSDASLAVCKERLSQGAIRSNHTVKFRSSPSGLPSNFDLVLVATPAHCRAQVVKDIATQYQVNSWILEKLLAQNVQQLNQIEKSLAHTTKVWVNTPRRLMAWHQAIRTQMLPLGPVPLHVCVRGGSWGLACNAIHFIDLVTWWTQSIVQSISCADLGDWVPSKRDRFQEVLGTLSVSFTDGSKLDLSSNLGDEPIKINVVTPFGDWLNEESEGRLTSPD